MHTPIASLLAAELTRDRVDVARRRLHDPSSPNAPKRRS